MNINGTICRRLESSKKKDKVDIHRISNEMTKKGIEEGVTQLINSFPYKVGNKNTYFVYLRDGYMEFLKSIMQHPRIIFAQVSSIKSENIVAIMDNIFAKDMGLLNTEMLNIFD